MGIQCEYCDKDEKCQFPNHGDLQEVRLDFDSGNSYLLPGIICHYIADHQYKPPAGFIGDVMNSRLADGYTDRYVGRLMRVGFLKGDNFDMGGSPISLVHRLASMISQTNGRETTS